MRRPTVADCERRKEALRASLRLVTVGGGWIGLEVPAAARHAGVATTVLEADELPLLRVLGPQIARVFADLHRGHGVDLRTSAQAKPSGSRPSAHYRADSSGCLAPSRSWMLAATTWTAGSRPTPTTPTTHQHTRSARTTR